MDDPFKKWQWYIDQWFVMIGIGGSTTGYSINIPTFPQFDSYSTQTQSVKNCDLVIRNIQYTNKPCFLE